MYAELLTGFFVMGRLSYCLAFDKARLLAFKSTLQCTGIKLNQLLIFSKQAKTDLDETFTELSD